MTKLLLTAIQVVIGIYWAGEMARQNAHIDQFVTQLEEDYKKFNALLKDTQLKQALPRVGTIYGWISIVCFAVLVLLTITHLGTRHSTVVLQVLLVVSAFGWFSVAWCLRHKEAVKEVAPEVALVVLSPALFILLGYIANVPTAPILIKPFQPLLASLGLPLSWASNQFFVTGLLTALLAIGAIFYYLLAWLLAVPAVFVTVALISLTVLLAKAINSFAPRRPLFGFTVLLFILAAILKTYALAG